MTTKTTLLLIVLISTGVAMLTAVSFARPETGQDIESPDRGNRFEYATLLNEVEQRDGGEPTRYQLIWNAGAQDFIGESERSESDAMRRLAGRLGITSPSVNNANNARYSLSLLLTNFGQEGWQLIETDFFEFSTRRIFIRRSR